MICKCQLLTNVLDVQWYYIVYHNHVSTLQDVSSKNENKFCLKNKHVVVNTCPN